MRNDNLILTGFMGTGKSSLGRRLAKELNYKFVDTDQLIEDRLGKTITELFQDEGEAVFRKLEAELVQELAKRQGLVIATGGGLMMNPDNVATLEQTGQILCLVATPEEILERISLQPGTRPLLKDPNPLQKITELLEQRATTYGQFTQISTSGQKQKQLITELLKHIVN
jgi:shikimate kinase